MTVDLIKCSRLQFSIMKECYEQGTLWWERVFNLVGLTGLHVEQISHVYRSFHLFFFKAVIFRKLEKSAFEKMNSILAFSIRNVTFELVKWLCQIHLFRKLKIKLGTFIAN